MAEPQQGINFKKIIENALSLVVTSVFVGACAIVWKGVNTVDDRVKSTEKNLQVLINNLSSKLSSYEVQLEAQSNQLVIVYTELKTLNARTSTVDRVVVKTVSGTTNAALGVRDERVQRAIQQDIYKELQMKK